MTTNYVKRVSLFIFLGVSTSLFSQNIGININGATPSPNAILDLNTGNNQGGPPSINNALGLDVPNVYLVSLGTFSPPMVGAANATDVGMLVYNTNPAVSGGTGYYCWNGATWLSVAGAAPGTMWLITGNSNIVDGTNFFGTTTTAPINFSINGNTAGRIGGININTFLGYQSGNSTNALTTGTNNAGFGVGALYSNASGSYNTAFGANSLYTAAAASGNTGVGYSALYANTGTGNTGIGFEPMLNGTSGNYNIAAGYLPMGNAANTGSYNAAIGYEALYANTSGTGNVGIGYQAMLNESTGGYDLAVGYQSMGSGSNSGTYNIGQGYKTLYANTTGAGNIAGGYFALAGNTTGSYNTALGYYAIGNGVSTGSNNIGMGYEPLFGNTTGTGNIAVGYLASELQTTGSYNNAIGYEAQLSNTGNSSYNNAIGYFAGYEVTGADNYNNSMGYYAGYENTGGSYNNALGYYALYGGQYGRTGSGNNGYGFEALYGDYTGSYNNGFGYFAGYGNYSGSYNNAFGYYALYDDGLGAGTGSYNIAFGNYSLYENTSGVGNIAMGYYSMYENQGCSYNIGLGYYTLYENTQGSYNNAFGIYAQEINEEGSYNNSFGYYSGFEILGYYNDNNYMGLEVGYVNEGGSYNNAIGTYTQFYTEAGYNNSMGYYSLYGDDYGLETGTGNNAFGLYALYGNYSGSFNTGMGYYAGYLNNSGSYNNDFGYQAMYGSSITGSFNNAIGYQAMYSNTSGMANNAFGYQSMYSNTTGSANVGMGDSTLTVITSGTYNTALGNKATIGSGTLNNTTEIGNGATASASNQMIFGNSVVTATEFNGALMPFNVSYSAGTSGFVLTSQGPGLSSIWATAPGTANNGLTVSASTVQLGGPLIENTSVTASAGSYSMDYDLGTGSSAGTGNFTVTNGGSANTYLSVVNSGAAGNPGQVGVGTASPNASAVLDVTSSTKGVLVPRLTTAAISAIASPANGLVVYNVSTNCYEMFAGQWVNLANCGCTPLAPPASISGPTQFCAAASNQVYTCTSVAGAVSYVWSISPSVSGTSITGTGTTATANFAATPENYVISVADINASNCQSGYANYNVVVAATPPAPPTPTGPLNPIISTTQTYTIATTPGYTYTWSSSNTNVATVTAAVAGSATVAYSASAGVTNICVTASANGCTSAPSCLTVTSNACNPSVILDQTSLAPELAAAGSVTFSITTVGPNEMILICINGVYTPFNETATVDNNNATQISQVDNSATACVYGYVAPTAGTHTIVINETNFSLFCSYILCNDFAIALKGFCTAPTVAGNTSTVSQAANSSGNLTITTTVANSYIVANVQINGGPGGAVTFTGATPYIASPGWGEGCGTQGDAAYELAPTIGSYTIAETLSGSGGFILVAVHP